MTTQTKEEGKKMRRHVLGVILMFLLLESLWTIFRAFFKWEVQTLLGIMSGSFLTIIWAIWMNKKIQEEDENES